METTNEKKILVVDDVDTNIDILVSMLEDAYDVAVALSGQDALEAVDEELPDLIYLDIMMPDMDGYEVCERLKSNPETADIPVVFLSALSEESEIQKGLNLGAVDFISKPFRVDEIRLAAEKWLTPVGAQRAARSDGFAEEGPRHTVMVVDDISTNIDVLAGTLGNDYEIMVATDGPSALEAIAADTPDIILLDIMMPEMNGYEVCRRLKSNITTRSIPVIFVTAMGEIEDEEKGFEVGAVDYITKPISPPIVRARVGTHLALYDQNRVLDKKVKERTTELKSTRLEIIRRLGRAAEFKDNETGLHVVRMSYYSKLIALSAGLSQEHADILFNAAPMHDIGKIGIPDKVLRKPGKLDDEEWELMQQHTSIGGEIIGEQSSELLQMARTIALTHHEKWNGKGYHQGLSREDIPLESRIVAIADVFDALTSERPYKEAWPVDKTVDLIKKESGEHFDPMLVDAFVNCLSEILDVKVTYAENSGAVH